jgi:gamma-glutamylcyclotransferase (GGCT)/AIG2-like uncharacterized protein YtfP
MTDLLFVYGTLMRAAAAAGMGREMRARLDAEGTWCGPATVAGRLYDLGRYPGLVSSGDASDAPRVHGEVYRLRDPAASFAWLDPYEGIPAGRLRGDEYERLVRTVVLAGGEQVAAWLYHWHAGIASAVLVPDGRWVPAARG